jgi:alkanesulfonate monooxygenase SsuD/methylene tetrahydromethanopterin reductase-like flavin-dependent oxidoreductase (luciferase family)
LKHLWKSNSENPKSFRGKYYQLDRAYLQLGQENRPLPIVYLAAFGPRMLKLCGREADGWIPHCHTSETYNHDLKIVMDARQSVKRGSKFHPAYYTLASVSKNPKEADKIIIGPAKYFLALIPEALTKIDPSAMHPGRIWEKIRDPRLQREMISRIASSVPDSDGYDTVIHGSPDDCIEQIAQYQKAGCKEFMLTFVANGGLWSTKNLTEQIRYFKRNVMDYYNA